MKYRLRYLNCVQETDSEDRKNELLQKGYALEGREDKKQRQKCQDKNKKCVGVEKTCASDQLKTDEKKG